ncbi:MAG TPA: methylmalonyl-CoA mutase, partial [Xanthobacteraceae bacterium]|nr:methylmalonyl-CoA mutase [Xanthobacteraceae bacterium]
RTDILTGTNEFPDIHESKPAVLDVAPVTPPREDDLPISFAALPRMRLAEPFEVLRDASDRQLAAAGTRPKIFLACLGSQADFTARASFAKNFFEAGGIEAASGEGNASALGAAFATSGAALACLCGSDKAYETQAAAAAAALKASGAQHIYLAGQANQNEQAYRNAGIQTFIYSGCDALSLLGVAHELLGLGR